MKTLIILLFFIPCVSSSDEPANWALAKEKNGIKIYSRHSDHSKFNDLKIETELTGSLSQITNILLDVEKYPEWAYGTKSCELIKKISDHELIYYSEIQTPWPVSNRDFYAHCKITLDSISHSLKLISVGVKDYGPEKKDIVRILLSKATWNVSTVSDKMIHVEYFLELDPGGTVPPWLLNLFSTKGPIETFTNLKRKLSSMN